MKKYKNFFYLLILLIFIIFLYTREVCYPKFGDIFGISNLPIQTYGFFIAMAFLFGSIFLKDELKRLHVEGKLKSIKRKSENKIENIFNLFFSFFFGYQLIFIINGNYQKFLENPEIILSLHLDKSIFEILVCFIGGVSFTLFNIFLNKRNTTIEKDFIEPQELIGSLLGITLISGVLGAKIFYLFETEISWQNLTSFGGLTFYGGLICGTLGVIIYSKLNKISIPHMADAFAPILMLSYAIGRVACHVSGDGCWGKINKFNEPFPMPDWLWKGYYKFGQSINNEDNIDNFDAINNKLIEGIFPTPIYETIICLIFFGILWSIRKKIKIGGLLFSIYLILNGIERFFMEMIRVNKDLIFNLTQGQIIAISLFLFGITLSLYLLNNKKDAII